MRFSREPQQIGCCESCIPIFLRIDPQGLPKQLHRHKYITTIHERAIWMNRSSKDMAASSDVRNEVILAISLGLHIRGIAFLGMISVLVSQPPAFSIHSCGNCLPSCSTNSDQIIDFIYIVSMMGIAK